MSETTNIPYNLSIRITTDGFSFILLQQENAILKRTVYCPQSTLHDTLKEELVKQNLVGKAFQEIVVTMHSKSQLVPNELYREEDEETWCQAFRPKHTQQEVIANQPIPEFGCHNLFVIPQKIHATLKEAFGESIKYQHIASQLIESTLKSKEKSLSVYQHKNGIDVVVISNGHLMLSNHFATSNDTDAAYWILNIMEQFQLPTTLQSIQIVSDNATGLNNLLQKLLTGSM